MFLKRQVLSLSTAFSDRKPWAAFLLSLLLGTPVYGMLYLGRGQIAVAYLVATIFLPSLLFLGAHCEIIRSDPRFLGSLFFNLLLVGGAFHCYIVAKRAKIEDSPRKWYARWQGLLFFYLLPLALAGILFVARLFLFEPFYATNNSMEPTLSAGDFLLVDKNAYNETRPPERGDVVVFRSLRHGLKTSYVKRIIGLPGDEIVMRGSEVMINGVPVKRQPLSGKEDALPILEEILPGTGKKILVLDGGDEPPQPSTFHVPQGSYFIMGDNRSNSIDSRHFPGFVPRESLSGKVVAVYWNEKNFKLSYKRVE